MGVEEGSMLLLAAGGYHSLYLQAGRLAEVLTRLQGRRWRLLSTGRLAALPQVLARVFASGPLVYHYGGFDPAAFLFLWRPGVVFVYHNITPAGTLARWQPWTALGALLGRAQLRLAPRRLAWVAVSPFNRAELQEMGFRKVALCPCLVEPHAPGEKSPEPSLLFVGRLAPNKNWLELLDAAEKAGEQVAAPLTLHLVGASSRRSRYARAVEERISGCRERGWLRIIWHSRPLEPAELDRLYASAWLYVSLSQHEGFGLPVLEAILAGTPAVYRCCGGTETILERRGALGEAGPAEAASAMVRMLGDPAERATLLAAQRELAERCTPGRLLGRVAEVYGALLPVQGGTVD